MPESSPKQQANNIYCQQADDFTVVTTTNENDKENINRSRNYQTLNQTIALERLQLLKTIELENSIFTKAFSLIETYYRPITNVLSAVDLDCEVDTKTQHQTRRKRRNKIDKKTNSNLNDATSQAFFPRKRIHGLSKAFQIEYNSKINQPGISKHFSSFYHDQIDWQLVFAPATNFPCTKLAKELNYDSLFDYEDAIAITANLLAIARQQSDLIDLIVLYQDKDSKSIKPTDYVCDQSNYGGWSEFQNMIVLIKQLIQIKKDRLEQLRAQENIDQESGHSTYMFTNWFKNDNNKCGNNDDNFNTNETFNIKKNMQKTLHSSIQQIAKEVNTWEELVDMVEISTK